MASIDEIARYAGVSVEGVVRVINNETVGEDVEQRVQEAIALHGFPHRALSATAAEPPPGEQNEPATHELETMELALERAREQLAKTLSQAAADLESRLPEGVGSVVYDAVRIEVAPVAQQVQTIGDFFEHLIRRVARLHGDLQKVRGDSQRERSERVEDLALLVDLVTTSWRNVDRRLGRIERKLDGLETQPREDLVPEVLRTEERRKRPHRR